MHLRFVPNDALVLAQHDSLQHGAVAELVADLVDGGFHMGLAHHALIGEVALVGIRCIAEVRSPDPDQSEGRAVAGSLQELTRRIEQPGGKLRRREARAGSGQQPEILVLELQGDAAAGKPRRLEPARDLLR